VSSFTPALAHDHAALLAATNTVVALGRHLERVEGTATRTPAAALEAAVRKALDGWCSAQEACCKTLLEQAGGGLWPTSLWNGIDFKARTVDTPCPCCGLSPTIERVYDSPPGPARIWSECTRCDITTDRPLVPGYPTVALEAPSELRSGHAARVKITLTCDASRPWYGAGLLAVPGADWGGADPARFEGGCDGASTVEQYVTLSLPEPPAIAHLNRTRALLLLNNHFHWTSRWLLLAR
jgi:hypothetical protein